MDDGRRPPLEEPANAKRMRFANVEETRQSALVQRQQLADTILNEMYQFVAFIDPTGHLLTVNTPALIAGGVNIEEVYLKPFWECYWWSTSVELPNRVRATVMNVAAGNTENYEAEVWGAKNGKATILIDFTLKPVYGANKQLVGMIAEARDITAKKAAERELVRKNEELQHLYKRLRDMEIMRSQFFANVSHELRTPLALILGPTENFLRDPMFPQEHKASIQVLRQNALLLLKHVNDILDLSKLDASKMDLHYSDSDIWRLASFVCSNFKLLAEERRISFGLEGSEGVDWRVVVDEEKLTRVLLNLLSNAFKFTPSGGRIVVSLRREDNKTIELKVIDNGPGVPESQREAIFERFRQGDPQEGRQQHGGTGLGLAIVKEFVSLHGGAIAVSEAPGGGACFALRFPVAPTQPVTKVVSTTGLAHEATQLAVSAMRSEVQARLADDVVMADGAQHRDGRARVLLVEDNADMRRFIRSSLMPHFNIYSACDGAQGLAEAQRLLPDVIVTDVMMPVMNGDVMMTKLRQIPHLEGTPVLLLTAKADDDLRLRMLEEGVADFMSKPFSVAELISRVRNLAQTARVRKLLQQAVDLRETNLVSLTEQLSQRQSALQSALVEAKQARDEADRLNRIKSEFLMVVSHELRTPLHGIFGWAEMFSLDIRERGAVALEDVRKGTQVIQECSQVLLRMIDDILELSRVASGRVSLHSSPVDLHDILSKSMDAMFVAAQAKHIQLNLVSSGHVRVNGDAIRLQQVFCNLITNAVKFTPESGAILATLDEESGHARVRVRDSGIGIDPKHFSLLFKHFSQIDGSASRKYGGLGIGLALCRHLVELHGGTIGVDSEGPGKGATFTVILPSIDYKPAPPAGESKEWKFDWLTPETSAGKK